MVQQNVCDYKDKHVVLGMIHSVANRDYGQEFYNHFGMLVSDECHHVSSPTWSSVVPKFKAKYRVGLSATLKRAAGDENVFFFHIGNVLVSASAPMMKPSIRRVWTNFHLTKSLRFNPSLISKPILLKFLCANVDRNLTIVNQIIQAAKADRTILVLSERVKHLNVLMTMFKIEWAKQSDGFPTPSCGLYIGELDKKELDKNFGSQILFATVQLVSEAFDKPQLDTVVLTTPMSDVTQAVGRILRTNPNKKNPIVVDIRDDLVPLCKRLGSKRDDIYDELSR